MARKQRRMRVADLYGAGDSGNLLLGKYSGREDIVRLIQRRHERGMRYIIDGVWMSPNGDQPQHQWRVPYGVRAALTERLLWTQIANKYPFQATWQSSLTGKRFRKQFMSLPGAIDFIATQAQYVDPLASVIAKHGFVIPTPLLGKFPRKSKQGFTMYWCPRCMDQRRYRSTGETFYARRKFPVYNKRGDLVDYEWRDVKLALLECRVCRGTNRDDRFRMSNQPLEKRKFKPGVRRAARRRRR